MGNELAIIARDGAYLVDSRVLAMRLGYEHKIILQAVRRHRDRLEAKSVLLQIEAKPPKGSVGGRASVYYLLDERQCLILAGSLKKGTEADAWHDRLVDAFLEARHRVELMAGRQTQGQPPALNHLWEQRLIAFNRKNVIPQGYWSVFGFVAGHCFMASFRDVQLVENALPDGSIGRLWCQHLRADGYDMSLIRTYPHTFPDKRGKQPANIYPNAWMGAFWDWFHACYLKEHYPRYLAQHRLELPAPGTPLKQLKRKDPQ